MSGARKKKRSVQHVLLSPPYRITESTKDLAISYWLLSTKNQHDHPRCI